MEKETESVPAYQRNRLRALDNGLILLISITSLSITGINFTLGTKYAIAVLPLLIPILVFPLIEGVIIGTMLKDSLKWRTRGWLYFISGAVFIPLSPMVVYGLDSQNLLIVASIYGLFAFRVMRWIRTAIPKYFNSNFDAIRVSQDIDYLFLTAGFYSAYVLAGGAAIWSLVLLGKSSSLIAPLVFILVGVSWWWFSCLGIHKLMTQNRFFILQMVVGAIIVVIGLYFMH